MGSERVAMVTCEVLPEPDVDERPLLDALRAHGLDARMLAWDDDSLGPDAFDLCVVRSTWNYPDNPAAFRSWLEHADRGTRLLNPLRAMTWNLHKRYLLDLEARGLATVPTALVKRGEPADLSAILRERGWDDVVVKPAIGAGSRGVRRFTPDRHDAGACYLGALSAQGDTLVQPYLEAIERGGERAVVWLDGEATHVVEKAPRFDDGEESVSGALGVLEDERATLDTALALLDEAPLYARLDVIRDDAGALMISELELVEPSLFLIQHPPAMERFVRAIASRL